MKEFYKKFMSFLLAVTLCLGILFSVTPSFASGIPLDTTSVERLNTSISMIIKENFGVTLRPALDYLILGEIGQVDAETFDHVVKNYNKNFLAAILGALGRYDIPRAMRTFLDGHAYAQPVVFSYNGVFYYRLRDMLTGEWVVDSTGAYPYVLKAEYDNFLGVSDNPTSGANEIYTAPNKNSNQWVSEQYVDKSRFSRSDYSVLAKAVLELNSNGDNCRLVRYRLGNTDCYVICKGEDMEAKYYCDSTRAAYAAPISPAAADLDFTYIGGNVVEGDDNSTHTEINGDTTINLPGVSNENVALKDVKNVLDFLSNNNISVTFDTENIMKAASW